MISLALSFSHIQVILLIFGHHYIYDFSIVFKQETKNERRTRYVYIYIYIYVNIQINGNSICLIMGECSMIYNNHLPTMTFFSSTANHFFLILSIIMIKIIIFKYIINKIKILITVLLHFTR